ncbi:MAG: hypothetical protein ACRD0U_18975, partial [Acidimicrobiales bacterium]
APRTTTGAAGNPTTSPPASRPAFTTAAPALGSGTGGTPSLGETTPVGFPGGEPLAAVLGLAIVAMTAGLFWPGSSRLADNVLAATGASCPQGMDQ